MPECGTAYAYAQGCRCDKCREAVRIIQNRYRATDAGRAIVLRRQKIRNRAAYLALKHLRGSDKMTYYKLLDEARTYYEQKESESVVNSNG